MNRQKVGSISIKSHVFKGVSRPLIYALQLSDQIRTYHETTGHSVRSPAPFCASRYESRSIAGLLSTGLLPDWLAVRQIISFGLSA